MEMHLQYVLRIVIAGVCGFFIGFERKNRAKEAGIRTHFIVAASSALIMIISKYAAASMDMAGDPTRIAAQIVTGIGFLGAGTIFVHGRSISGLTTAAGIWATSGIGMAIGSGMYIEGVATTLIILLAQIFFRKPFWSTSHHTKEITLKTGYDDDMQQKIMSILKENKIILYDLSLQKCEEEKYLIFIMTVDIPQNLNEQKVVSLFEGDCSIESH